MKTSSSQSFFALAEFVKNVEVLICTEIYSRLMFWSILKLMYSHFPLKWLIISVSLLEFRCGFIILVSYHFSEFRVWNLEELKTAPNGVECVFWSSRRNNGSLCELFALQNRMFLFVSFRACCVIAVAMIFPKQTRFYHMEKKIPPPPKIGIKSMI